MTSTETRPEAAQRSSLTDERFAGWKCTEPGTFHALDPPGPPPKSSWLRPSILWSARNDPLVRLLGDPTDVQRRRWVAAQRERGVSEHFAIDRSDLGDSFSCLIRGRYGGGNACAVRGRTGAARGGQGNELPRRDERRDLSDRQRQRVRRKVLSPVLGLSRADLRDPGQPRLVRRARRLHAPFLRRRAARRTEAPRTRAQSVDGNKLWPPPSALAPDTLARCHDFRAAPGQQATLPAPYSTIDSDVVRFVGIDTGINGNLDGEQGDWLRKVSAGPKPKILLTGKPLYVKNRCDPGRIVDRDFTVDVVRDPANNYVAAIGGDIHHYRRYRVRVGDRTIQYIVSSGGGAFMHATHTIPEVDVAGVSEDESLLPAARRLARLLQPPVQPQARLPNAAARDRARAGLGPDRGSVSHAPDPRQRRPADARDASERNGRRPAPERSHVPQIPLGVR
jgi:hypothetical protein